MSRRDTLAQEAADGARGHGDYRRTRCPFCIERLGSVTNNPNFWVSQVTGFYGCHRCEIAGRLPGFEDDSQYIPDTPEPAGAVEPTIEPPEDFCSVLTPTREMRAPSRYLQSRGVTKTAALEAGIGACVRGSLAGRIVIPVFGIDGRTWLGWASRLYREPKGEWEKAHRLCPEMQRGSVLFNLRALASSSSTPIICCEGAFDSIKYWPHTVAFLGKPSGDQLDLLASTARPLAICLDGDAWRQAEVTARQLRRLGKTNVGWVKLPAKLDPNNVVDPERLKVICADSVVHGSAEY